METCWAKKEDGKPLKINRSDLPFWQEKGYEMCEAPAIPDPADAPVVQEGPSKGLIRITRGDGGKTILCSSTQLQSFLAEGWSQLGGEKEEVQEVIEDGGATEGRTLDQESGDGEDDSGSGVEEGGLE